MVGFLERLFGRDNKNEAKSGKVAKDRLQLVLVQDRVNLPAEKLQEMKREMIEVLSKYVSVDMDNVDFNISNRDRSGLLVAEIPFLTVTEASPSETAMSDGDVMEDDDGTGASVETTAEVTVEVDDDRNKPLMPEPDPDDDPTKPLPPVDAQDD